MFDIRFPSVQYSGSFLKISLLIYVYLQYNIEYSEKHSEMVDFM